MDARIWKYRFFPPNRDEKKGISSSPPVSLLPLSTVSTDCLCRHDDTQQLTGSRQKPGAGSSTFFLGIFFETPVLWWSCQIWCSKGIARIVYLGSGLQVCWHSWEKAPWCSIYSFPLRLFRAGLASVIYAVLFFPGWSLPVNGSLFPRHAAIAAIGSIYCRRIYVWIAWFWFEGYGAVCSSKRVPALSLHAILILVKTAPINVSFLSDAPKKNTWIFMICRRIAAKESVKSIPSNSLWRINREW